MCGIIGIFAPGRNVANDIYTGLFALQHRGQESTGLAVANPVGIFCYRQEGTVNQVLTENIIKHLPGFAAIGHVRYSTTGDNNRLNAQPMTTRSKRISDGERIKIALAHNGNLTNAFKLKNKLQKIGFQFYSTSDSEIILNLIASASGESIQGDIINMMRQLEGTYSLVMLIGNKLWAVRDPLGVWPLYLSQLDKNKQQWAIASETCALDVLGAKNYKEVPPGAIVMIDESGYHTTQTNLYLNNKNQPKQKFCVFEFIYFSRPDSKIFDKRVQFVRKDLGRILAQKHPVKADICINIPDSSTPHAQGFSEESRIPLKEVFIKNRYVHRTFIQPNQSQRNLGVKLKLNLLTEYIKNREIVIIEDSIVRGTTAKQITGLIKEAGARKVHMRIASPPYKNPCFYGIDTAAKENLIGYKHSIKEIKNYLGVDSLEYLTLDELFQAIGLPKDNFCHACFSGEYPIKISKNTKKQGKYILET